MTEAVLRRLSYLHSAVNHGIVVPADGTGAPLVVMLTVQNGSQVSDLYCQIGFSAGEWSPDILTHAHWHLELPLQYVKWGLAGYQHQRERLETMFSTLAFVG